MRINTFISIISYFSFLLNNFHYLDVIGFMYICGKRALIFWFSSNQIPAEQLFQVTLLTGCRVLNILLFEDTLGEILLRPRSVRLFTTIGQYMSPKLCIELV